MNSFRSALEKGGGFAPSGPLMPGKKPSGASEGAGSRLGLVPREAVRNVNHRDDDRHRLQAEEASLKVGRKTHAVELINLSGGGAMIRTDVALDDVAKGPSRPWRLRAGRMRGALDQG